MVPSSGTEGPGRLIGSPELRQIYGGISKATLERWKKSGKVPKPDMRINGRDRWTDKTIKDDIKSKIAAAADGQ